MPTEPSSDDLSIGPKNPRASRTGIPYRAILEALAVGILLGFADSRYAGDRDFTTSAYFVGGVLLGLRHAGRASVCWPLLGTSLYAVHVVAIACGRTQPYVEENYRFAEQCLWIIVPAGLGLILGVGVRVALSAFGWFRRRSGPAIRFLPKTTRDVMVTVACIAVGLGCFHRMIFPPTTYALGYSEARFHTIREGMTSEQVLSALGPPLQQRPWSSGVENWIYSDQYTYTSNYDRRWIFIRNGVVSSIVHDYWLE